MHDLLRQELLRLDQNHLVAHWSELNRDGQARLESQLATFDLSEVATLRHAALAGTAPAGESAASRARRAQPVSQVVRLGQATDAQRRAARERGHDLLRSGRVGIILVAGGQGTRLDFARPKGQFPIAPVSRKTLFQLLAEQVRARGLHSGRDLPYYVMTSDATHADTTSFFEQHQFFGLDRSAVHFFRQGNMPALDRQTGQLLLAGPGELSLSPDGHGGIVQALARAGLLDEMRSRGVDRLFYHQVDNPLVHVADPEFLGFHEQFGSELSTKVVAKLHPAEKVGLVVEIDGRTEIVEYSDLPDEMARETEPGGGLKFWAGNTAIHCFNRDFLERLQTCPTALPFHIAVKKVPYWTESAELVRPDRENAVKFERFIFDALPQARQTLVVEVRRDEEFAPLKNKSGEFSPDHVRQCLQDRDRRWLAETGIPIPDNVPVEISPLFAIDREQLQSRTLPPAWPREGLLEPPT